MAQVAGVEDATFTLLSNGDPILAGEPGPTLAYRTPVAPDDWTAYRVEVFLPDAPGDPAVPWIVSNPIYVGGAPSEAAGDSDLVSAMSAEPSSPPEPADGPAASGQGRRLPREWQVEQRDAEVSVASGGLRPDMEAAGEEVRMTFELGSDAETYAAAVQALEAGELVGTTAVRFEAEASQPMRLSLQLRRADPAGGEGDRWRRSFYVGTERRAVTVPFDQLVRVTPDLEAQPDLAAVDSLLIVVDTVNAFPGTRGSLTVVGLRPVAP